MLLVTDLGVTADDIQAILDEISFNATITEAPENIIAYNRSTNLGTQRMTNSPFGLHITDQKPPGRICGATYPYGSVTVYWSQDDIDRTGELAPAIFKLRVIHELLHHFNKPADNIADWLKDKPIYEYLFYEIGKGSGETYLGAAIQMLFYKDLAKDINEEEFNNTYHIKNRMSNGLLL